MDYKKKYEEALERAKKMFSDKEIDYLFPELKESEEERIRKELLNAFQESEDSLYMVLTPHRRESFIAWLEKQSEQNPYSGVSFKYNGHIWGMCARDNGVDILLDKQLFKHLEKKSEQKTAEFDDINAKRMFIKALERVEEQNNKGYKLTDCDKNSWWEDFKTYASCTVEHNPADKVNPKFHEGDWVVSEVTGSIYQIKNCIENISNHKYGYYLINGGYINSNEVNRYHLWTIQDAKDGDIIYLPNGNNEYYFFIFKGIENAAVMSFAHFYQYNDGTSEVKGTIDNISSVNDAFQPATKEQRDLLFQKMKEAGYEWDAEKKELKKIVDSLTEDNLPEFESYLCFMFQKFRTKAMCTNGEIIDYVKEHSQKLKDTLSERCKKTPSFR